MTVPILIAAALCLVCAIPLAWMWRMVRIASTQGED